MTGMWSGDGWGYTLTRGEGGVEGCLWAKKRVKWEEEGKEGEERGEFNKEKQ